MSQYAVLFDAETNTFTMKNEEAGSPVKDSISHVYAAVGESWVEVVTLEGVTGLNAQDMLKDGMLLA